MSPSLKFFNHERIVSRNGIVLQNSPKSSRKHLDILDFLPKTGYLIEPLKFAAFSPTIKRMPSVQPQSDSDETICSLILDMCSCRCDKDD